MHDQQTQKLRDTLKSKLSELRNHYAIEKEANKSKLQLVEIKYKNL